MRKITPLTGLLGLLLVGAQPTQAQERLYVDDDATPGGDGLTWATAYEDLQAALDAAALPGSTTSEIWVAAGTYVPSTQTDPNDPRTATFQLLSGVAVYGGFAG